VPGMSSVRFRFLVLALTIAVHATAAPAFAQLAGRAAEEWIKTLDSPARVAAMKIPEMVAALKITPGQTIADVGAGSGAVTGPLAIATGPTGVMYAVDIDQGLLTHIERRARDQQLGNIKTVLGAPADPKLPSPVDLAFMHDVLHHVSDRVTYLKNLASYIKPGGRLALIDYRPDTSPHRSQPELVVSEEQADAWLRSVGLVRAETVPLFEDRYYVIYSKPGR
jgi:ubiquinone/menaquinone biosynthesis C-methylase UbiE